MRYLLRLLHRLVPFAAIGAVVGVLSAVEEIERQAYLEHGFWRTSLWISRDQTVEGAGLGAAAGLALLIALGGWSRVGPALERAAGAKEGEGGGEARPLGLLLRLVAFLAACSVVAALFVPAGGRVRLHLPYILVVVGSFSGLWVLVLTRGALAARSVASWSSAWFRLRSLAVVGAAFVAVFLRAWQTMPRREATLVGGIALPTAIEVYFAVVAAGPRVSAWCVRLWGRVGVRRAWWALSYLVLCGCVGLWAAGDVTRAQARSQVGRERKNVIIIGVETLRSDRVSLLSKEERDRDLTPNLRELLARRGTVFSDAITQAPWTLPAVSSIFTGLYPEEHGGQHLLHPLPASEVTLAEIVREAGYETMGVVSAGNAGRPAGLDQGFSVMQELPELRVWSITSPEVTDRAIRLLRERGGQPFFLFAYYCDPHYDYLDHKEFDFADGYSGWLRQELAALPRDITLLRMKEHAFGEAERQYLRDLYDEEIAYTDAHIGRLLAYLDEAGLWDSTLVIFFADHGEEFYERGWIGHTVSLHEEVIHVPMAIAAPSGEKPRVFPHPVETRWIFGTVLDFLGLSRPADRTSEPSLLGSPSSAQTFVRSSTRPVRKVGRPGTAVGKHVWLSCLVGERWKVIKDHLADRVMLFDRQEDPGEKRDVSEQLPELRREMEKLLEERDAQAKGRAGRERAPRLEEEDIRELRSLGYL